MNILGKYVPVSIETVLNDVRRDTGYLRDIEDKGDFLMVTCPFHGAGRERTPSMGISTKPIFKNGIWIDEGYAHCFGCGYKGRFTKFLSDVLNTNEFEILKELKKYYVSAGIEKRDLDLDFNIQKNVVKKLDESKRLTEEGQAYLEGRNLDIDKIKSFKVYSDEKRVYFPLLDKRGNVIGEQSRNILNKHFHNDKSLDKQNFLYGLYQVLNDDEVKNNYIFIVESIIDSLTLWSWGYRAVALMGAKLSPYHVKEICKLPYTIIVATDNDEVGSITRKNILDELLKKGRRAYPFSWIINAKDINELTKEQFEICINTLKNI